MDRNGYNPSCLQHGTYCYACGKTTGKLDRHEVFGGPYRQKSKELGLWVLLCHETCHLNGVHQHPKDYAWIKDEAQRTIMQEMGWTVQDFIDRFGKNYLEE